MSVGFCFTLLYPMCTSRGGGVYLLASSAYVKCTSSEDDVAVNNVATDKKSIFCRRSQIWFFEFVLGLHNHHGGSYFG